MSSPDSILNPAIGYLELGMLDEANDEIESLPPELKNSSDVLTVRMEIYRAMKNWSLMETVTRELWKRHQDNPSLWNELAFASRHSSGLEKAHSILCEALKQFPDDSLTLYNLGCYDCQLGDVESAKARIGEAIKLDPKWKIQAVDDPDLEPMWDSWS